ncbi:MAG: DUF4347 domain-containing protein, partial [Cyanobacteria bacterium P01_F01_bin.143]
MLLAEKDDPRQQQATILVAIAPTVAAPHQLAKGVQAEAEVLLLDPHRDSIAQITTALAAGNYQSLHLVSHGSPGCIHLGNSKLNLDTLPLYAAKIATWFSSSSALSASLLLYGCNVAQGESGQKFLNKLQQITQAQIQASSTKIGNPELGGNWQLDTAVGVDSEAGNAEIVFNQATQQAYSGIFVAPIANDDSIIFSAAIALSALDGSNGFILNGIDADDDSGRSVSSAGDVNGDGLADLIIGAYGANSNAGESYVVFGSSNPSSVIELSDLDGSNGFVLNGIDGYDYSGRSVSSAGDVNGDGLADLIIGAFLANGNQSGDSYVVFGSSNPSSAIELSDLDGSNGFVLNGIDVVDRSGRSVSSAGDVNGDGTADLIIGAPNADPNGDG